MSLTVVFPGEDMQDCHVSAQIMFTYDYLYSHHLFLFWQRESVSESFFEILTSNYGPGPYGYCPGPLIILKNLEVKYAPGPYLKSTLLQKHISNMLLDQCAFQI